MMETSVIHETIAISRLIKASSEQVFDAWEDPDARAQWGPPSEDESLSYTETDFRVGGKDVQFCGRKKGQQFRVETLYHDIQRPGRLLFSEQVSLEGRTLSVSLVTVVIGDKEGSTKLDLTIQVAGLTGNEMIKGIRTGWTISMENLERFLVNK